MDEAGVFFVIRGKENIKLLLEERPLDKENPANKGIQYDWQVEPELYSSRHKYVKKLRMVQVSDDDSGNYFELLTNNFSWTASTISELYRKRWTIESFFNDIKQHLKIKSFVGTSRNAVLTQIWTALITILLRKTLQKQAKQKWHLSNLVVFIRINLFVKIDLQLWLDKPFLDDLSPPKYEFQMKLFFRGGAKWKMAKLASQHRVNPDLNTSIQNVLDRCGMMSSINTVKIYFVLSAVFLF